MTSDDLLLIQESPSHPTLPPALSAAAVTFAAATSKPVASTTNIPAADASGAASQG